VGFALVFVGQILSGVSRAILTVTALAATFSVDGDEAGGQDGTAGLKLFEPGLELAADESGMLGNS
jgi:hypothetical protein